MANWCMNHEIHMIVNEIYALSQINTKDPEISDDYQEEV